MFHALRKEWRKKMFNAKNLLWTGLFLALFVSVLGIEAGDYRHYTYGVDFNVNEFLVDVNGALDTDFSGQCFLTGKYEPTNLQVFDQNQMQNDSIISGLYYLQIPASDTTNWLKGKYNVIMACTDNDLNGSENVSFIIGDDLSQLIQDTNSYLGQLIIDTNAIGRGLSVDQNQLIYDINTAIGLIPQNVWNYSARTLTDYNQSDLFSYLQDINGNNWISAQDVWEYATRTITDYNQNQMFSFLQDINATTTDINGNTWITASDVWNYADRILTDYNQNEMWNYLMDINSVVYDINSNVWIGTSDVWDYATRTLSDYNQSDLFVHLQDINATIVDINGNSWLSAFDVWNYADRILTDYNQNEMWNYLIDINAISFDINSTVWVSAQDVWEYTTRTITDYNQNQMFSFLQDINVMVLDINGNSWISTQDIWTYSTRALTDYNQATVFAFLADINAFSFDTNATTANIWMSRQQDFKAVLSDFGKIAPGSVYRAKLWIFDFEGTPIDADSTPTMTLYDSSRNIIAQNIDLNYSETGIYTYSFITSSGQTAGQWEAIVTATINSTVVKPSDWWELTGNPPEVTVNQIITANSPTINANITLTNEGTTGQEYQYEYCIVAEQTNSCGRGNDVDYASGAKFISAGESWNPILSLTVSSAGTYWFKVKVYYGSETSAASRQFSVTAASQPDSGSPGGGFSQTPLTGFVSLPSETGEILITEFPSEMVVRKGDFEFFLVKIKNLGPGNLNDLALRIDDLFLDWYQIEQDKTKLVPNEEASFIVKIMVPREAELKDHLVQLKVSSQEDSKEVQSVLRVLEPSLAEIGFSEVRISRMMIEDQGTIEVILTNQGLEDINLTVSLLAPLDWRIQQEAFDVILLAGQRKKVTFLVNTSYRSGVQDLVLVIKSKNGIIFRGIGEDQLFKELLVIVHPPQEELVSLPLQIIPLEWIIATIIIIVIVLGFLFFNRKKFSGDKKRKETKKAGLKKAFEIKNMEVVGKTFSAVIQARDKQEQEVFTFDLKELPSVVSWQKKIEEQITAREKIAAKQETGEHESENDIEEEKIVALEEKTKELEKRVEEQEKELDELEELQKQPPQSRKQLLEEKKELEENSRELNELHSKELISKEAFNDSETIIREKLEKIETILKPKSEVLKEQKELEKALKQLEKTHSKKLLSDSAFEESKKKIEKKISELAKLTRKK
ncbi:hypothetical protein KKE06_01335 [Candidatus Micrarchaeota archaeon]|nr:hypothetical protein [Candidatus Micrarchaeota archaeon]MBU1930802.1 hypothetical protein [Candidatus Micrarchaeota archaeon]